ARLGQQRVATVPLVHPTGPVFRVKLDILQFEGNPGNDLILRVHWIAQDEAKGTRAWSEQITIRRPLEAEDITSLVAAHDQALGQLSDVIAARIASLSGPGV
ncbi:MAG: ABC-type transport auxiliary lipoprotein family protein, partial [Deltaproteobacteria bacterium]|nr:ABC-type transport auxiliary lipoprotein family protein [Deltaproteobacteria bacterium]